MFLQKAYIGSNKWYWYLLTVVIVFIAMQLASIPLVAYNMISNSVGLDISNTQELSEKLSVVSGNTGLFFALLSFAVGLGVLLWCVKLFQYKRPADIITGRRKIDWGRFGFATMVWGVIMMIPIIAQVFTDPDVVLNFDWKKFIPLVIIGLVMFPLQTGFEEVIFRGYFMQGFALIFKYRWVPIVITSLMFGLMHGANPEIEKFGYATAMPQYIITGLILGYVAVKDDGLELAWGMHFVNNFLSAVMVESEGMVFRTAAIFKDLSPEITHWDTLILLIGGIVFIFVCNAKYKFFGKINIWKKIQKPSKEELERAGVQFIK